MSSLTDYQDVIDVTNPDLVSLAIDEPGFYRVFDRRKGRWLGTFHFTDARNMATMGRKLLECVSDSCLLVDGTSEVLYNQQGNKLPGH